MTIPRLQGWFDELEPSLTKIAKTIGNKLNYNNDLQLAMQQEVAKNPALLQQFADLKARDPEILRKMGLTNIDMFVGRLPESSVSVKDKQTRGYLESPTTSVEEGQKRAGALGIRDPLEQQEKEQSIEQGQLNIDLSKLNKRLSEALFSSKLSQGKLEGEDAERQLELIRQTPAAIIARNKLKNNYANKGQLTPEEYTILSSHPDFKEGFEKLRDDYWNAERQKFTFRLSASERSSNQEFSLMARWAEQIADYGGTDPMSVIKFTTLTPDQQKALRESTAPPSPEMEALWRAGQGMNNLKEKYDVSLTRNIVDTFFKDPSFNSSLKVLNNPKITDKQSKINALSIVNGVFAAKGRELGIANPPQLELNEIDTWGPRNKLELTLSSGDLSLAEAIAREGNIAINTPTQATEKTQAAKMAADNDAMDALAQAVNSDLSSLKTQAEKDKWLADWSEKKPPAVVAEVRKRLSKFGAKK